MSTRPLVITFQRKIYMQIEEVTELIGDDEVSLYLFILNFEDSRIIDLLFNIFKCFSI